MSLAAMVTKSTPKVSLDNKGPLSVRTRQEWEKSLTLNRREFENYCKFQVFYVLPVDDNWGATHPERIT